MKPIGKRRGRPAGATKINPALAAEQQRARLEFRAGENERIARAHAAYMQERAAAKASTSKYGYTRLRG